MPTYSVTLLESPVHPTTPLAERSVLYTGTGANDIHIKGITWELNGHGTMQFTLPKDSTGLTDLVEMGTEVQVTRDSKRIWWGIPVKSNQRGELVDVQCVGLSYYLERRFIGSARTNLITGGDMDATTPALPTGWSENDLATPGAINAATVTAGAAGAPADITDSGELLEIRGNAAYGREVDKNNDGKAVDSPTDPDDYHGYDAQVVQAWTNSTADGHVYICKGWFYLRDDATYPYGGKPYDKRGFYVQEQTSGGAWAGEHWWHPIDDNTKRNEWVRAEISVFIRAGNKGQIRLYAPATNGTKDSAIYWTSVGVYQEESLSFYGGDGGYVTTIIEGIVDHANGQTVSGYASDKQDVLLDADPANSSNVPDIKYPIAYQAHDHKNAWREILAFTEMRSTATGSALNGPYVGTTWSANSTARYIYSRSSTGSPKSAFRLHVDGSSYNIIDGSYTVDGTRMATRVITLGQGDGPDREEATHTDVSVSPIEWESIVNTGNSGVNIRYLDDFARAEVAHRHKQRSLRFRIPATTAHGGWSSDPITGTTYLRPGDKVQVSGSVAFGRIPPETENFWRVVKMTLTPADEVLSLELNESTA